MIKLNWKRIALQAGALLLAGTGAALAATSGLPMDGAINQYVHFTSTDVAIGLWATGAVGVAYHAISGRDTHHILGAAAGSIIGGTFCALAQPASAALGLSAGALIKLLA